ncbi:NAD(P)/FAD-dependent oxidoreductase [Pseudomonas gingeri]|uniref:NAD(P)/FAD-dependent oxidoreductase n=1 Tax=Pseudomonas gingeri TaxID=117681 RepID=A0A7Y7XIR6_9PSED|nr:NAD(P)/FAD-dependent oxidoreductase [Pseudomonas gingeri]NWB99567.1 NAD(P)/FAD-dependent oxidoreductase [Pseudomonas gingeri]NWD68931.1 NAD(P)/FAD-dependent oxidoreductase [Pseudomonas gingeri]
MVEPITGSGHIPSGDSQEADSYCVIGAGPSGLATSRALTRLGIPHVVYEKYTDVGGIWDIENPGTPMYESAHFISSKWTSGFIGFPMPGSLVDYPHHPHILAYLRRFADAYNLRRNIVFNASVSRIERADSGWRVHLQGGRTAIHRGVICASGVTWLPSLPAWPGSFEGEIRHSITYRSAQEFSGKRVLIVGLGNSGADIACDAARNALSAAVSVRRGYHFLPKHVHGWPIDVFSRRPEVLPEALRSIDLRACVAAIAGDPTRFGMPKPDHEFGQAHPLLSTQLLHYLAHGDIEVRPDIKQLDGRRVVFTDGSEMEVDLILAATGYQVKAPYLDDALFDFKGQRTAQYLNVFNLREHELFTIGFAEVAAGIYPLIDQMAHLLAHHLHDRLNRPETATAFETWKLKDDFDPRAGKRYVDSDRHSNYVDLTSYQAHTSLLCERFGWPELTHATYANAQEVQV